MIIAPPHPDEALRQYTLNCLNILDTAADVYLETIVRVAQNAFGVDTVLISLIDRDRQWFKMRLGLMSAKRQGIYFVLQPHHPAGRLAARPRCAQ
jgi:hypothetical protein